MSYDLHVIRGPIFAIVTPFDEKGMVDEKSLVRYLSFLEKSGVETIIVNGTNGEFPSTTIDEKIKLLETTVRNFSGKVISHISSCSYIDINNMAQLSSMADALLILPPFYYDKIDSCGLVGFFELALEGISTPAYLYDFPHYTKNPLSVKDVLAIRQACSNIVGIKVSGNNFKQAVRFSKISPEFDVFFADDQLVYKALKKGLNGSISGASNPYPEYLVALHQAWRRGDAKQAKEIQQQLSRRYAFRDTLKGHEIAVTKKMLSMIIKGFSPMVRSPLTLLSHKDCHRIEKQLNNFSGYKFD